MVQKSREHNRNSFQVCEREVWRTLPSNRLPPFLIRREILSTHLPGSHCVPTTATLGLLLWVKCHLTALSIRFLATNLLCWNLGGDKQKAWRTRRSAASKAYLTNTIYSVLQLNNLVPTFPVCSPVFSLSVFYRMHFCCSAPNKFTRRVINTGDWASDTKWECFVFYTYREFQFFFLLIIICSLLLVWYSSLGLESSLMKVLVLSLSGMCHSPSVILVRFLFLFWYDFNFSSCFTITSSPYVFFPQWWLLAPP